MTTTDRVRELIEPIVASESATIYDIEHNGGILRILIESEGGVDVSRLRSISRAISRLFDEIDPIPGRYTLEVSSPGLERPLRNATHFRRALGVDVRVKTRHEIGGKRRFVGTITDVDDNQFTIRCDDTDTVIAFDEVSKARTTFEWGPTPKPGSKGAKKSKPKHSESSHREATS